MSVRAKMISMWGAVVAVYLIVEHLSDTFFAGWMTAVGCSMFVQMWSKSVERKNLRH